MNWKSEAVDKLRQYEAKKLSLVNIPLEISRLESAARGIRSAASDGTPVSGGGSGREDMLLSNIVHREELERSLEQAKKWVAMVDTGLAILSAEEHLLLERFYIHQERGDVDRLIWWCLPVLLPVSGWKSRKSTSTSVCTSWKTENM